MNKKLSVLIAKLIELTRLGKLPWVREQPPPLPRVNGEAFADYVYSAIVDGEILRVSRIHRKTTEEDYYPPGVYLLNDIHQMRLRQSHNPAWTDDVVLEVVDPEGRVIWRSPKNQGIYGLFDAILETQVDLDDLIGKLEKIG